MQKSQRVKEGDVDEVLNETEFRLIFWRDGSREQLIKTLVLQMFKLDGPSWTNSGYIEDLIEFRWNDMVDFLKREVNCMGQVDSHEAEIVEMLYVCQLMGLFGDKCIKRRGKDELGSYDVVVVADEFIEFKELWRNFVWTTGLKRNGCLGDAVFQIGANGHEEGVNGEAGDKGRQSISVINVTDEGKEQITDWVVIKRMYLEVVGPDEVFMDLRNFNSPGKTEEEIYLLILEFKKTILRIANNPGMTGIRCICDFDHGWNLCSNF